MKHSIKFPELWKSNSIFTIHERITADLKMVWISCLHAHDCNLCLKLLAYPYLRCVHLIEKLRSGSTVDAELMEGFSQVATPPPSPQLGRLTLMRTAWFTRCAGSYLNAKWWRNGSHTLCKRPERAPLFSQPPHETPQRGISPAKCSRSDMIRQNMGIIACQGWGRERGGVTDSVGWWGKNGRLIMYLLIRIGQLGKKQLRCLLLTLWETEWTKTNSDACCEIVSHEFRRQMYSYITRTIPLEQSGI